MQRSKAHKMLRGKGAFTMIEVLAVMVIIMLLAGMVLGMAGYARRKATESRALASVQRLCNAISEYQLQYGYLPPVATWNTGILNPWLESTFDYNDPWGQPYLYTTSQTFQVRCTGFDKTANTADDIVQ